MKIVGTKLDNSDYERFEDFCLKEELTKSEVLRDLIKQYCNACEEGEEIEYEKQQEKSKPVPITNYKILDDNGKVLYDNSENKPKVVRIRI